MSNIEYSFYNGENTTTVDRPKKIITMNERGGWSRSYTLTFKELLNNARKWDIKINLKDSDEMIAQVATNIILANNAVSHDLDPFRFIPRTNKITDPRDKNIIKKFEYLLNKYSIEQVLSAITEEKKIMLKEILIKK